MGPVERAGTKGGRSCTANARVKLHAAAYAAAACPVTSGPLRPVMETFAQEELYRALFYLPAFPPLSVASSVKAWSPNPLRRTAIVLQPGNRFC